MLCCLELYIVNSDSFYFIQFYAVRLCYTSELLNDRGTLFSHCFYSFLIIEAVKKCSLQQYLNVICCSHII